MVLIDSNIIIESTQDDGIYLRKLLRDNECYVSMVTLVETLGYHRLTKANKDYFYILFLKIPQFPITHEIIFKSIEIRQKRKLGLGDSLIAATAVIHKCTIYTRNIKDFDWINDLEVHNPMDTNDYE